MDKYLAIRVFLTVVKAGSFVKAAERLNLSTTTCSRLLSELESALGARLVQRTTRSLSITEAGLRLASRYEAIDAEIDAAEQEAAEGTAQVTGLLRIAMPQTFGLAVIAPALRSFRQQHPALQLDVQTSDRRVDLVADGFDLALRIASRLDGEFVAKRLATIRTAVCAAPAYLRRRGTPTTPADLADHECLAYSGTQSPERWTFAGPDGPILQRIGGSVRSNSGEVLHACALAGDGIIFLPTFLIGPDLAAGRLVQVLRSWLPAPMGLFAIYPDRRHLPARTRAFIDFLTAHFAGTPPWDRTG